METKRADKEIMKDAVDTLLEKGVEVPVTVDHPNALHRMGLLKKRRVYRIFPISMGTLDRIAQVVMGMKFAGLDELKAKGKDMSPLETLDVGLKNAMGGNSKELCRIIAIAIMGRNPYPRNNPVMHLYLKRQEDEIADFLHSNMSGADIYRVLSVVIRQMQVNEYLGSLVSIKGMSLVETKSPTSGNSSEVSSNTSDSPTTTVSGE